MTIRDTERAVYQTAWGINLYHESSPGDRFADLFAELAGSGTVLDAGCGGGKGMVALAKRGFTVAGCDLVADALEDEAKGFPFVTLPLWDDLKPVAYLAHTTNPQFDPKGFDWVYCTDVLEHIPPEFTMLVIRNLLEVAKKGVFFSISTTTDVFGAVVGRNLHLSVYEFSWWRDHLKEFGRVVEARDFLITGMYLVVPGRVA